jgi:hypothetical protein
MSILKKILAVIGIKPWPEDGYHYFRFNGWKDDALRMRYKTVDIYEQRLVNWRLGGQGHPPGVMQFWSKQADTDYGTPIGALIEVIVRPEFITHEGTKKYLNEVGLEVDYVDIISAKKEMIEIKKREGGISGTWMIN